MVATILISALVAIAGLLLYAFATNPKLVEVGRIAFGIGLLVTVLALSHARLTLP